MNYLGITASAIERVIACPASVTLGRVSRTSEYAERGHSLHGFIRAVLTGTPPATALASVDEAHRETARGIDWETLVGDLVDVECEPAFALNLGDRTARRLGHNIDRNYADAAARAGAALVEDEICGSADLIGRSKHTHRLVVVDVKSGFKDVAPAAENAQGLFFASVLRLLTGEPSIDFRIAKLKPSGRVWNDRATFTPLEMDLFLDDVDQAMARVREASATAAAGGLVNVTEGDHCTYCPGLSACPAKTGLARAMLGELAGVEEQIGAMTLDDAGRAWMLAHDRIAPLLERVLAALKERAKLEPLPLEGGKVARAVESTRETLNGLAALDLARSLGAEPEAIQACYRTQTITQIRSTKAPRGAKRGRAA